MKWYMNPSISIENKFGAELNIEPNLDQSKYILKYPCNDSSECVPYKVILNSGIYQFNCYGAAGGKSLKYSLGVQTYGGKGGFSTGTLYLRRPKLLWFFIGGKGFDNNNPYTEAKGGFNGGGIGGSDISTNGACSGGGGGGGTDIRYIEDDLYSRIIVAGGGGGASPHEKPGLETNGGEGGGTDGGNANNSNSYGKGGQGGHSTEGGSALTIRGATSGIFGFGGNGSTKYLAWGGGGGGGGWFGGGGGSSSENHSHGWSGGGGGGSGYVGGVINGYTIANEGSSENGYIELIIISSFSSSAKTPLLRLYLHFLGIYSIS